jgi:hypothetical protein
MKKHDEASPRETFFDVIADWLSATGEVFVVLRFPYAAGSRDYAFCGSLEAMKDVVERVPAATDVIVFRSRSCHFAATSQTHSSPRRSA